MKKAIICSTAFALAFGFAVASNSIAADKGPADMVLKTAAGKKPANFPHAKHQAGMECAECHHSKTADGKKGPYEAGKEAKCESCHNDTMANKKLDNYMKAAHENCKGCHKEKNQGPTKCDGCHK